MTEQTPAAGGAAPNHRILVVDDNPAIHDDIRKILAADSGQDPEMALDEIALFNTPAELTVPFEIDHQPLTAHPDLLRRYHQPQGDGRIAAGARGGRIEREGQSGVSGQYEP